MGMGGGGGTGGSQAVEAGEGPGQLFARRDVQQVNTTQLLNPPDDYFPFYTQLWPATIGVQERAWEARCDSGRASSGA